MKMFIILVAAASTIVAGCIHAQQSTEGNTKVYRQGNSTATITQDGASSEITVERDTDSQTIEQRSDGNSAVIKPSTEGNTKVYQQGNSTATITQDGASSEITVERDTDSQTIEQRSDSNSAVIKQSTRKHAAPAETKKASKNRVNYKTRGGIELQTSEKFRRLFLDRLDKSHFD
ncbi:secreted protein [Candidatus Thiomargarita nelsonii]|uniref:Secreted protein n=1 Tax=Candidatus Thiomargarita nelsonii TaxID=1003181 RepID=A0A176S7V2_9GAMM|nr:secreted protein [Candidatus Thiomargarita nelsonii]